MKRKLLSVVFASVLLVGTVNAAILSGDTNGNGVCDLSEVACVVISTGDTPVAGDPFAPEPTFLDELHGYILVTVAEIITG